MNGTFSQAHPEAGGVRGRRNEFISEVIEWIGSLTYVQATVTPQATTTVGP